MTPEVAGSEKTIPRSPWGVDLAIPWRRECAAEVLPMNSSAERRRILLFVVILGLFSLSASGGAGGPPFLGKGYSAATFYVA
jgi:hypothetical protein